MEKQSSGAVKCKLMASFIEVADEKIYDLLRTGSDLSPLKVRGNDMAQGRALHGAVVERVSTAPELSSMIERALERRAIGSTDQARPTFEYAPLARADRTILRSSDHSPAPLQLRRARAAHTCTCPPQPRPATPGHIQPLSPAPTHSLLRRTPTRADHTRCSLSRSSDGARPRVRRPASTCSIWREVRTCNKPVTCLFHMPVSHACLTCLFDMLVTCLLHACYVIATCLLRGIHRSIWRQVCAAPCRVAGRAGSERHCTYAPWVRGGGGRDELV